MATVLGERINMKAYYYKHNGKEYGPFPHFGAAMNHQTEEGRSRCKIYEKLVDGSKIFMEARSPAPIEPFKVPEIVKREVAYIKASNIAYQQALMNPQPTMKNSKKILAEARKPKRDPLVKKRKKTRLKDGRRF